MNKTKHIYYTLVFWTDLVKVVQNLGSLENDVSVLCLHFEGLQECEYW